MKKNALLLGLLLGVSFGAAAQFTPDGDIISSGINSWIFHTPDDGRTQLHIAPMINGTWNWNNSFQFSNQGELSLNKLTVYREGIFNGSFVYNEYNGGRITIAAADPGNVNVNTLYSTTTGFAAYSPLQLRASSLAIKNAQGDVTGAFTADGNLVVGGTAPENSEGWEKVINVRGTQSSKIIATTNEISTGLWAHYAGFYSAPAGGIVGTNTNHPFSIITNKSAKMVVLPNGNVGIGITAPSSKLMVDGMVRAREVKVDAETWPDYVFDKDYVLPDLYETERFIQENKHLPGIPKAAEITKEGLKLGEINVKLMEKIEELTLQLIKQQKQLDKQAELIDKLIKK